MLRASEVDPLLPATRLEHGEPCRLEKRGRQLDVRYLVVDHQDTNLRAFGLGHERVLLEARQQRPAVDGLDEVVDRAEGSAQRGVVDHGDDHDRDVARDRVLLETGQHLPAVDLRQQDVEDHRHRHQLAGLAQGLRPVARDMEAETAVLQVSAEDLRGLRVVVHHQHERAVGLAVDRWPGHRRRLRRHRRDGQPDRERAALAPLALDAHGPAVQQGEAPGQGKAQTRSLLSASRLLVQLLELAEQPVQVRRIDADPGVGDGDLDPVAGPEGRDGDRASGGCELDRVREEVEHHLLQLAGVGDQGQRRFHLALELDGLRPRQRLHRGDNVPRGLLEVDRLHVQVHLAGLDLREVQDVVDQLQKVLAAGVDLLDEAPARGVIEGSGPSIAEQLREPDDRVERRPQLVAHAGEEPALGAVRAIGLRLRQPQLLVRLAELPRALVDHRLELAGQEPLALQELRSGDGVRGACGEGVQEIVVRLREGSASLHAAEVQATDHAVLGDHRDHHGLSHPPSLDVPALVRREVRRKVVGVDGDVNALPLLDDLLPGAGRLELDLHAEHLAGVLGDLRVGVVGGDRLDGQAVGRQQDHSAQIAGGAGDVLGDQAEESVDMGDGVAESARRLRNRSQPFGARTGR